MNVNEKDLNILSAKHIMKWTRYKTEFSGYYYTDGKDFYIKCDDWSPLKNANQRDMVVGKMEEDGWWWSLFSKGSNDLYAMAIWHEEKDVDVIYKDSKDKTTVILETCLQAVEQL